MLPSYSRDFLQAEAPLHAPFSTHIFNNPGRFDIFSHKQWGEAWEFLSTKIIRSCKPISEDDKMVKKKHTKRRIKLSVIIV